MFVAWSIFLVEVFERIGLTPLPGETEAFIPAEFINAGFGDTSCLGDCTETNILASENFDVNNITFSQYKNHTTGKTAVWITPHGSLLQCSDTYPGTISDNDITEQCGVLDMVRRGSVVLTDKGFGITEMCLQKGLHHNRPPLKFDAQYDESEISKNFDIATLRIYNENYIGRMRDWAIINASWPSSRIDLLGYVHKLLAHIVWFQKISIPPPRRELEIPEGWGGQRPRKFRRGGGGGGEVVSEFTFPDGQVRCHANLFQNRFLPTLKIFYIEKNSSLGFRYTTILHFKQVFFFLKAQ